MRIARLSLWASLVISVAAPAAARQENPAKPADPPADKAATSPEAAKAIERMQRHYAGVKGLGVRIVMKTTSKMGDESTDMETSLKLSASRPNRIALRDEEQSEFAVVSDGKTLWQYFGSSFNRYEEKPAPESFAGVLKAMSMGMEDEDVARDNWMAPHILAVSLLDDERLAKVLKNAKSIKHVGREDIAARPHDRVHIESDQSGADLWIAAEGEAWLARVVPDMHKMMEDLPAEFRAQVPTMEIEFKEWKALEEPVPETFAFKPPEGAEKVDSLMKAMQEQFGRGDEGLGDAAHQDLLGKQAPDVELELLDGGKMSLASHRGKDVVVLDFWATWCPPCVQGLPVVSKAAADLRDKGVVFYAVNQREKLETIQKFMEKRELKFPVPLDKSGTAGKSFKVGGIPQTVLIGRDGTVQAVHVGFDPSMEERLIEELKKLCENKPLVTPEAKPKEGDAPKSDGK